MATTKKAAQKKAAPKTQTAAQKKAAAAKAEKAAQKAAKKKGTGSNSLTTDLMEGISPGHRKAAK